MATQPRTTITPVNPTPAEAALPSCGPAQMEGCIEALRELASQAGDSSTFADRTARFRKTVDVLIGAGHDLSAHGRLIIPDDAAAHPDAQIFDAFARLKAADVLYGLAAAPDWSEEQDRLGKLVDDAENAFFALVPRTAGGLRTQTELFILTNDNGSGTAGAFSQELLAGARALAEREHAWLRPLSADPIHGLFEQRKALNEKLHADLTAATNRAEGDATNAAFANARERIEAEIVATPPQTRAGLIYALNVVRDELPDGEQNFHMSLLGILAEAIERAQL